MIAAWPLERVWITTHEVICHQEEAATVTSNMKYLRNLNKYIYKYQQKTKGFSIKEKVVRLLPENKRKRFITSLNHTNQTVSRCSQ